MTKTSDIKSELLPHYSLDEMLAVILTRIKSIEQNHQIALPDKHGLNFIELNNIMYCKSDNSYTEFYIAEGVCNPPNCIKIIVSRGFDVFEEFLTTRSSFFRVHNQYMINTKYVKRYIRDDGNYLIMEDQLKTIIPVARARRDPFLRFLKSKGFIV